MNAKLSRFAVSVLALCSVCALVSCQSSRTDVQSALKSGHWKLVQNKPPIYFPKGTPANHPTGFRDGYWVSSGDERGTQFFIPVHRSALSRDQLIAEARAARSPAVRKASAHKQRKFDAKGVASEVVGKSGQGLVWLFTKMGEGDWGSGSFNMGSMDFSCANMGGMNCAGM